MSSYNMPVDASEEGYEEWAGLDYRGFYEEPCPFGCGHPEVDCRCEIKCFECGDSKLLCECKEEDFT